MAHAEHPLFGHSYSELAGMSITQVRSAARENDESSLWPVTGLFNATERSIRALRREVASGGREAYSDSLEYALALDSHISYIVNHL